MGWRKDTWREISANCVDQSQRTIAQVQNRRTGEHGWRLVNNVDDI
jgi:hypothetical protein